MIGKLYIAKNAIYQIILFYFIFLFDTSIATICSYILLWWIYLFFHFLRYVTLGNRYQMTIVGRVYMKYMKAFLHMRNTNGNQLIPNETFFSFDDLDTLQKPFRNPFSSFPFSFEEKKSYEWALQQQRSRKEKRIGKWIMEGDYCEGTLRKKAKRKEKKS